MHAGIQQCCSKQRDCRRVGRNGEILLELNRLPGVRAGLWITNAALAASAILSSVGGAEPACGLPAWAVQRPHGTTHNDKTVHEPDLFFLCIACVWTQIFNNICRSAAMVS